MSAELIFTLLNIISAIGWVALIVFSPYWKFTDKFLIGIIVTMLAAVYSYLNFSYIGNVGGMTSFLTFDGVNKVLANPWLINAAWAHILAFDLMIGIWIKNNAAANGIPYWIVVIILVLTIMLGPLGLLLYQLIRWLKTKQYFATIT